MKTKTRILRRPQDDILVIIFYSKVFEEGVFQGWVVVGVEIVDAVYLVALGK